MEPGGRPAPVSLSRLARGSALITIANVVPRAGAFVLLPVYTHFLEVADFGTVSLAASGALLLATVSRLGLDTALLRMHHDAGGAERRSLYASVAATALVSVAIMSIVAGGAVLSIGNGDPDVLVPVTLLALAIGGANAFQFVPSVWFRGRDRTGQYLALALLAFLVTLATTVVAVILLRMGAIGTLAGQLAGAAVTVGAAAVILWQLRPWRIRADVVRRALGFGLPLLPHNAAGWLLNVSDRWLLALLLGLAAAETLAAVGVYSLGYQLGYAVGIVAVSFNAAWLPFLYRLAEAPAATIVLREATTVVVGGFVALAAVLAIAAPDIVAFIAPREWMGAADVTSVVAFASAANAAGLMFASGLMLARRTGAMPLIALVAGGVNVGCNLVLIPRLGIMGAAWATLGAYLVFAAMTALAASRRSPRAIDGPSLGLVVAGAVTMTIASRLSPAPGWHVLLAIVAVAATVLAVRRSWARLRAAIQSAGGPVGEVG